jgi:hypothetical protein
VTRTTYVYRNREDGGFDVYEKGTEPPLPDRARVPVVGDLHYAETRGPMGEDLSTRSKHRAFLKSRGLTTADDFTNEWASAQKKREQFLTDGGDHKARREQIERAFHQKFNR